MVDNELPRVAVMMSTYNGHRYLKEQLNSILAQSGVVVKCYIRDDGSTDDTLTVVRAYCQNHPEQIILFEGENIGCKASFRLLAGLVYEIDGEKPHDYYSFCDQDDVWLQDKLTSAARALSNHDQALPLLYFSNLTLVDADLKVIKNAYKNEEASISKANAIIEEFGTGCTMVFNRRALSLFLSFKPDISIFHDRWLYLLCVYAGQVVYDKHSYIYYRQHGSNVVGISISCNNALWRHALSLCGPAERGKYAVAKEFLKQYEAILDKNDIRNIRLYTEYRNSLWDKFKFLTFGYICGIRMRKFKQDLWLRVLIILGRA